MIRGVRFIIPQEWGYVLNVLLKGIYLSNKKWITYYLDFFDANGGSPDFVRFEENGIYASEELLNRSQQFPEYLFLSGVFAAFPLLARPVPILSYEDFIKSDCELLCTIDDAKYIKIYIKDANFNKKVFDYARVQGYTDIEYLTENNDSGLG